MLVQVLLAELEPLNAAQLECWVADNRARLTFSFMTWLADRCGSWLFLQRHCARNSFSKHSWVSFPPEPGNRQDALQRCRDAAEGGGPQGQLTALCSCLVVLREGLGAL